MSTKKIIIGLGILLVVLILIVSLLRQRSQISTVQQTPTPTLVAPTGIIVPTTALKPNELDIVSVIPADGSTNVSQNSRIEITFSRVIKDGEIKLYIDPPAPRTERITGNKLIATLDAPLTSGSLYRYSVYFVNEKGKDRTYSFTTSGPTQAQPPVPDTRDEEVINDQIKEERENHPDVYVSNQLPVQSDSFSVTSEYKSTGVADFGFIVTLKGDDKEKAKQDFIAWLQSLGLRDDQIASLEVQYQ